MAARRREKEALDICRLAAASIPKFSNASKDEHNVGRTFASSPDKSTIESTVSMRRNTGGIAETTEAESRPAA
eukprot:3659893-Rhodomonas_salina.2